MNRVRIPLRHGYLEILRWCIDHFGPIDSTWGWTKEPGFIAEFSFQNERDAVMFTLRWS